MTSVRRIGFLWDGLSGGHGHRSDAFGKTETAGQTAVPIEREYTPGYLPR
jgi:hypothetical protein